MSFLDKLKNFFAVPEGPGASFITFKVKCKQCGEIIEVKARKTSDISRIYTEEGPSGAAYFLRKEILGNNCSNLIYVTMYFGPNFDIISKDISGGSFID